MTLVICLLACTTDVHADTYSKFRTTRYYSANKQFSLKVAGNKRATLYRGGRRVWSRYLPQLPGNVLVTNDGSRVIIIDHYYGNGNTPSATVLRFLNERGAQLAGYTLAELTDLSRVLKTTSTAHWSSGARFTPDEKHLIIETIIAKYDPATFRRLLDSEKAVDWMESLPYERLVFQTLTGKLTERTPLTHSTGGTNMPTVRTTRSGR